MLTMMYMKDAIRATLELMDAPSEKLTIRGGYNLPSLSFSAKELSDKIKEEILDFECEVTAAPLQFVVYFGGPDELTSNQQYNIHQQNYELMIDLFKYSQIN